MINTENIIEKINKGEYGNMFIEVLQEDIDYCNKEFASFKNKKNRIEGFTAEKTIQRLVGAKPCKFIKEGEHPVADITFKVPGYASYDITVDVKNDTCDDRFLLCDSSYFCIPVRRDHRHADWLLFTKYSPKSRRLVVVGLMNYLHMASIAKKYRKGEVIPEFGGVISECDCYVVSQKDIPNIYGWVDWYMTYTTDGKVNVHIIDTYIDRPAEDKILIPVTE